MTKLFLGRFIKEDDDITVPGVRQKYGMLSGVVGILCNLVLFLVKLAAGLLTSSISVLADAFNNLSDAASSVVTLIGFKMAGKPADIDHPFGHGRIEYLSGLIVSAAIILMGYELLKTSVIKVIRPQSIEVNKLSIFLLAFSVLVKIWMALFYKKIGEKIQSATMKAASTDCLSDCVTTAVVIVALIISYFMKYNIDGYAGVVVACFVLVAGISTVKETLQPLLGKPADKELVNGIKNMVVAHTQILGVHDLIIHDYGPGRIFVTLHAEIPYHMKVMEAHDIIDMTEKEIASCYHCDVSIHMDPIVTDSTTVSKLKCMVYAILKEIDPVIQMHDFRITEGPYLTNLIFDIEIPYNYIQTDDAIVKLIEEKVESIDSKYHAVIHVDKSFTSN